jgi:hypothetical protein
MRGSTRTYWMPVSFLALARTLSRSIRMLTAWCAGVIIVVPVMTWSFLYSLQYFLLQLLNFLNAQRKLHMNALRFWGIFAIIIPGKKRSISLPRVFRLCNNFLRMWSHARPHASHMVWGASHFCGIAHVVSLLSLTHASHRICIGSLLLIPSSCAIMPGEAYLNLESAQESRGLFKVLNACWVPLAVRNRFWLYSCSLSWRKSFGPSSALANSLGLIVPQIEIACTFFWGVMFNP